MILLICFCCFKKREIIFEESVDVYVENHPNLLEKDKVCILEGRFEIVMLKQTVYFIAGEPTKKDTIEQDNKQHIKWYYRPRYLRKEKRIKAFIFNTEGYLIEIIKCK